VVFNLFFFLLLHHVVKQHSVQAVFEEASANTENAAAFGVKNHVQIWQFPAGLPGLEYSVLQTRHENIF